MRIYWETLPAAAVVVMMDGAEYEIERVERDTDGKYRIYLKEG
jgi:hypothetical protein